MANKTRETERELAKIRRKYRFNRVLIVVLLFLLGLLVWGWYESLSQVWGPESRAAADLAGAFVGLVLMTAAGVISLVVLIFETFQTHEMMVEAEDAYQDALDEAADVVVEEFLK